ncbi:hypothetical protein [Chroococcidiopsis sp.]|uniref:hypothetical protein n=1 Tax=Chroococcidiopsis sp. TaxID=3088168 RepID=UPI003F35B142
MPNNMYQGKTSFDNFDYPQVLATDRGLRSPRGLTLDLSYLQANPAGTKVVKPGYLLSVLPSGYGRIFPGSRAIAAAAVGATVISVRDASVYKIGEVVSRVAATPQGTPANFGATTALGTVQSLDTAANTITLSAASASALSVRDIVLGTDANNPSAIVGMILSLNDLGDNPNDVAAYTSATVYGMRLPMWDSFIQNLFPEITLMRNSVNFA